ncbi:MAG: glycosyltransferase family 4 protein [Actinomycetota bacterium]|nr:glycosyltransferase family 4 protein [Actinomycetota bacterium]
MTTRPIKVMRVIARMNVGGPAWQVSVLTRGLVPPDFESTLVCGYVSEGEADFIALRDPELPCRQIEGLGRSIKPLDDLRAFVTLVRTMRSERPDIVHTHTAKAGVLGRLAAIVARVPVRVHTFHGHVLHGYFSPRVTKVIVLIERFLASRTTALAAVGTQVRDDLLAARIGKSDHYTVVPPGVAIKASLSKAETRQRFGLPPDAPIALFVGRLTQIKRPDRLLEAFRIVRQSVPDAVLAIAGEGDLIDQTKALANDLGDSVRFLGWQSDLSAVYPLADVVVLTSDNEGMPVTLIEASMLGIPCVTTDVGSAREVVIDGDIGFVTSKDPSDIAHAVSRLLSNQSLASQFGVSAKVHAEQNFGTRRLVDDYATLYRRLIDERAPKA